MSLNLSAINNLVTMLGSRETDKIVRLAKEQNTLDSIWDRRFRQYIVKVTNDLLANASETGRLKLSIVDFSPLVMAHSRAAIEAGIRSTETTQRVTKSKTARLSAPPAGKVPSNFVSLRKFWDLYRKKKVIPPRQQAIVKRMQDAYLKKVQEVWREHGHDFMQGDTFTKAAAVEAMRVGAAITTSRAKMIVETETTYYYNRVRREIYDQSQDVTHYLFVAVRDHATTKWCSTRQGLVYAKGDPILERENPPCHWNCRSEIIPLTPLNPRHLVLIKDPSRQRRNNSPEPLPEEWRARG